MIVRNYYSEKTMHLLEKYGPGPRIHFHLGIYLASVSAPHDRRLLQHLLTQGQEDMMLLSSDVWGVGDLTGKRILDVGAGLGGATLWMATCRGAEVDALVQCEEHAQLIQEFAALYGVSEKVRVFVGDAHDIPCAKRAPYDAIYAMESPCYFDRERWFGHLATLLKEEGEVWIEDVFWKEGGSPDYKGTFDDYWKTDVGTAKSYEEAAKKAGFIVLCDLDITKKTTPFWDLSASWSRLVLEEACDPQKRTRLEGSIKMAGFHHRAWLEGEFEMKLLRFGRLQGSLRHGGWQ
ncbi:MAG: methyltransferase domain-containing protein [Myxococcales bacterium]|nr:methyltransferase domain-containing protein [Myxococcales bacterium]MCB9643551.1 methyltransferase domain-containing protein [Myxococcales bacterium]